MKKIKFRGKRKDNGERVYGDRVQLLPYVFIVKEALDKKIHAVIKTGSGDLPLEFIPVDPATVGQFTGLHDKNGQEIYGGDIVQDSANPEAGCGVIEFIDTGWGTMNDEIWAYKGFSEIAIRGRFEVIGNIHDNPELAEKGIPK